MRIKRDVYWSLHTHSHFSNNDAMAKVEDIVARASQLHYAGLGIQDHGNMAASVQLYQQCKKYGIAAFPGTEFYMVPSIAQHRADYANKHVKATRFHLGISAISAKGYQNLVALNTMAHQQHFHKPLIDFESMARFTDDGGDDGLVVNTGCFFGYLVQQLTTYGRAAARQWLATLESWFPGKVYVELQNHNITHEDGWSDDEVAEALLDLADELGLPCIITQDSHYINENDKPAHDTLKRLVAFGPEPDEAVFPGDGFHLADHKWMAAHHHPRRLERGCEGLCRLHQVHSLSIPVLDTYHYSVPEIVDNPYRAMHHRCTKALLDKSWLSARYLARLEEELNIIRISDMAGYMLLTAQICDFMRDANILYQTRGSAAGSLVCWLLGISNVDPVRWNLRFERFLSTDRTKPPDIDLDIEHERREEVIAWLRSQFAVHQISTWGKYSLAGEDDKGANKGSLRVKYFAASRKRGGPTTWEEVGDQDRAALYDLAERNLYSGLGKNAAGVVITSRERDFADLIPLHHMPKGEPVAQYNKEDVEALGLVKLDVLGSKTLTVLKRTLSLCEDLSLSDIELDDSKTFSFIRHGQTDGIFQLEGNTTKRGLRELKPTSVKHIIAAMALFRPAVMRSGATEAYCRRKNHEEETPQRHELIMTVTKETHGIMLYQEQTMDMMRLLGMGVDDLNVFLKAVKASNKDIGDAGQKIRHYMSWIETQCKDRGLTDDEITWVKEAVSGFAEYSFVRAHATVYGLTAYQCAWLCVHYPNEFHTALLAVAASGADKDKETKYLKAARSRKVRIRQPDVNTSGPSYTYDKRLKVIRKGLSSVHGVGMVSAEELHSKQPYASLDDLLERVEPRRCSGGKDYLVTRDINDLSGVVLKLLDNGALDAILTPDQKKLSASIQH